MDAVTQGYRLPCPEKCPQDIYQLMIECWTKNPKDRLSFKQIYQRVEELKAKYTAELNPNTSLSNRVTELVEDKDNTFYFG